MKMLFYKITIIVLGVFLFSLGLDAIYRAYYRLNYETPRGIFLHPEIKDKYEIVKLGNSHAQDGIVFDGYKLKALSLTRAAQSFDFDLAYLKMYSRQIKKGALIIITVSPIAFSQEKTGSEINLQTQYYDGSLSPFLIPNLKWGDYLQSRIFPFLRTGYLWRERISKDLKEQQSKKETNVKSAPIQNDMEKNKTAKTLELQTKLKNYNSNNSSKNYYLNVASIYYELNNPTIVPKHVMDASVNFMVNKWMSEDGFGTKYFSANRKDLEKLIKYCLEKKWRPVLVTIPISKVLLEALPDNYMQTYVYDNLTKTNLYGIRYFNFMNEKRLTDNLSLFSNSDHLNKKGATIFSYLLLQKLIKEGYLSKEIDGYKY